MIYLSLDQAARVTGWAVFDDKKLKEHGVFSIKSSLPIEQRLARFWQELNELKNKFEPNFIFFEDIQNQHNNETYKKLAYIQSAIILWCYFNNIKFSILHPSHWRKIIKEKCGISFVGKREAQKEAAIQFVKDNLNIDVTSDEADAITLGYAGIIEKERDKSAF
jgi:Holliday junction resolvasome RuvABC endonuclease subunit